jgi:hypothetical protein
VITPADNSLRVPNGLDAEWFAVAKEHHLADKCRVADAAAAASENARESRQTNPSFFWTVMSQNGNAPAHLGDDSACLPQCYSAHHGGWPPAVNASAARCPPYDAGDTGHHKPLSFNGLPMNQPKVMVGYTDPSDPSLRGRFNWTFELDADLAVPEADFPLSKSLGIWEWIADPTSRVSSSGEKTEKGHRGMVRIYQRVSKMYSWICTYFGADAGLGIKANQAYDGRGMMTEPAVMSLRGPIVKFWLNITKAQIHGGGVASWYAPNMEVCWDQVTRQPCRPYGNTNTMVHQQVLLDYGGGDSCTESTPGGCPRYHIWRNGTKVHRTDPGFPYGAYKFHCAPCNSGCAEAGADGGRCCDDFSNSNGQSIYKIAPHPEWSPWGFPSNASDGFIGDAKLHTLNVGGLFSQIWFPCMTTAPLELVTVNIGPETGYGTGTHDTNFYVADFDILMPAEPTAATAA